MTTATGQTCTAIVSQPYIGGVVAVNHVCGAEARWQTDEGEARCDWHATGNGRRIGPVEGTED